MSTIKAANLQNTGSGAPAFKNSSGTEIGQLAKAWVNFNGRNTPSIRDSFNVSSITDNATGAYTVNFTNAMANTNYATMCSQGDGSSDSSIPYLTYLSIGGFQQTVSITTSSVKVYSTIYNRSSDYDALYNFVAIFGD